MESQILQIDPALLISSTRKMAAMKERMVAELNNASNQISEISSKYKGNISSENINKFSEYSAEFSKFCGKIDQYIEFLNKTAAAYSNTDES
jgi:uncharacterized protein YukE